MRLSSLFSVQRSAFSVSHRWYVCGLLLMATTVNYMDRLTLSSAATEIKADFHLRKIQGQRTRFETRPPDLLRQLMRVMKHPLDRIVRTPTEMKWRLEEGESFTTTIVSQGKILYEKGDARVGHESRAGLGARQRRHSKPSASNVLRNISKA